MSWLDIVLIIAILMAAFTGLRQGLIKTAFSLAGVVVGVVLAGNYYTLLADRLTFMPEGVAKIVAFAIIVIGVMIIAQIAANIVKLTAKMVMLGWLDHLGGIVLGLVLGGLFAGAAMATWIKFLGVPQVIADSAMANILLHYFPMVLALLPGEFDSVREFFR